MTPRVVLGAVGALGAHPSLWPTALRQLVRLVPLRWWRRPPFLPIPDREYVRFRLDTQYGIRPRVSAPIDPADLVVYLRWCRTAGR